jgi:hypothetical protein
MVIVLILVFWLFVSESETFHGSATMTCGHALFRHSETNFCRKICPYKELVQLDVAAIRAGPITTGIATDMQVRLNEQRFSREGADVSPVTF